VRVLITDSVSEKGVDLLLEAGIEVDQKVGISEDEIVAIINRYDALIVRSQTKVTRRVIEAAGSLKVIGRAGVGVDNIDVQAATEKGIIVVNAPEGNTIAATEQTMALMLALSRHIPQAHASLVAGKWDRKTYKGVELKGKVLGILGLGKIGSGVAKRALAFEMKVLAYDPYVSPEKAQSMGVEMADLDTIFKEADFITVHLPLNKDTKYIIGAEEIAKMKPSVRIINVARGGVICEEALYEALKEGKIAGAAIDVWENEPCTDSPLQQLNNVVVTPHLGASTKEAQINVAIDVANEIITYAKGGKIKNAVNAPSLKPEAEEVLAPYMVLCQQLGSLISQTTSGNALSVDITYNGDIANYDVTFLTKHVLLGLLRATLNSSVNEINAAFVAETRGLKVSETKSLDGDDYRNLVTVTVKTTAGELSVSGTVFSGDPRIVKYDGHTIDAVPEGHLLIIPHIDKPGIVGPVAMAIGENKINIAGMQVGRKSIGGDAVAVLRVDGRVPAAIVEKIAKVDGVKDVKYVHL
jgi:D-3-phosphoglycerate dehydrogenase